MDNHTGKYDIPCEFAVAMTGGDLVGLIVLNGNHGSGFSIATRDPELLKKLPNFLETIAKEIREKTKESNELH